MTVVCEQLQREGFVITAFFYNPNIHPWKERERRLKALSEYADSKDIRLEIDGEYPLEENIRMLLDAENRCFACFKDRLTATADKAAELGIENFSTTLSVSPYQNQSFIMEAGNVASQKSGVRFIYRDFREFYRESIRISREAEMYRQPYCGCVFSERDRYLNLRSPGQV
ncbi:MAG: epoxyqueuosine reductase QueH [Candidatus Aegiribacteria sp.]|nr:epoxyqueuosine reductase QueH [Candidatus Aegiribacteria sp.]